MKTFIKAFLITLLKFVGAIGLGALLVFFIIKNFLITFIVLGCIVIIIAFIIFFKEEYDNLNNP